LKIYLSEIFIPFPYGEGKQSLQTIKLMMGEVGIIIDSNIPVTYPPTHLPARDELLKTSL